jgi:hypothetical protein
MWIFILFFFGGCVLSQPSIDTKSDTPSWAKDDAMLGGNLVVGRAMPTFQGMYMQRQNALFDARRKLSFKIRSIISKDKEQSIEVYNDKIKIESIENINEFSKVILSDITQYDAYISDDNELFILIGLSNENVKIKSKSSSLVKFDKNRLLNSGCYPKSILETIDTKSDIYKGKPLWFYEKNRPGVYTSIGIAEKIDNDFDAQKSLAITLATTNLVRKIKSHVSSKQKLMKMLKDDEIANLLESSSRYKSNALVKSVELQDIWMDPNSCELYIIVYSTR